MHGIAAFGRAKRKCAGTRRRRSRRSIPVPCSNNLICRVSSSVERSLPKPQRRVRFPYPAPSSITKKDIYAKNPEVSTVSPHRYTMCHGGVQAVRAKARRKLKCMSLRLAFLHKDKACQELCCCRSFQTHSDKMLYFQWLYGFQRECRKRQTSPRIKGRHLKENCCSPRWRSFIYEAYSILPGHLREAAFQPMPHLFRSAAARFAGAIADNGTDLSRSPSPFQSSCRSRC